MASSIGTLLADNFILILVIIAVLIIVIIVTWLVRSIKLASSKVHMAELSLNKRKMDLLAKRAFVDDLKNASIMLADDERQELEAIRQDKAVLSRKTLYLMNDVEERTDRLELGADMAKLFRTLGKVKKHERQLFRGKMVKKPTKQRNK